MNTNIPGAAATSRSNSKLWVCLLDVRYHGQHVNRLVDANSYATFRLAYMPGLQSIWHIEFAEIDKIEIGGYTDSSIHRPGVF